MFPKRKTQNPSDKQTTKTKGKTTSEDSPSQSKETDAADVSAENKIIESKKVKLRVSMQSAVFEIELDKLRSKPETMLGSMFSSDIAKPNKNGEYEIKDVNPMLFENVLHYYNGSKIPKPNLRANFLQMTEYLQIPTNKETLEDYFLTELRDEKNIMEELNKLFDDLIKPLMHENIDDEKNYKINVIEKRHEDNCDYEKKPNVDNKSSFNYYVKKKTYKYLRTYNESLERFFKTKGIVRLTKSNDSLLLEDVEVDSEKDYNFYCQVEYVVLDFWC